MSGLVQALDLRRMADTPAYIDSALRLQPAIGNKSSLRMLLDWFRSRDADRQGGPADDIPTFDAVESEFKLLSTRLQTAHGERPYSERWRGAAGVVLMKDVFTTPRFYDGCQRYLHLWLNCALKSLNEAVVEGMGGVWDRSSPDARHCSFEHSAEEAVVAWNGPWPYHPEAEAFINHALAHCFGTSDWGSRFQHVNARTDQLNPWSHAGGKVVVRHRREDKGRLPASMYNTPA